MAERRTAPGFKKVQLFRDQVLGIGSYGKVCRTRCDDLDCAAKILHQTLFDPTAQEHVLPQRGHRLPVERFEKECEFMSALRHPNIVQYLGLVRDSDTGLKVLLMELMDISLTHFLEKSTQLIPYHIQVNICHDITLALSFLHSNNLIHRDLSGNNVLLTKDATRAKVTDFGMTQLYDLNPHRTFTMCPGTAVYMPPEALQGQPRYTEKIDCFSFGVILLQILTRQFPDPGNHQKRVEINHPGMPRGQLMVCIPEVERRQNHIHLVNPNHSLLTIALDCLRDREGERPTAKQLCERVAILRLSSVYGESAKVNIQQVQGLQQILKSQTKRLEERESEIQKLKQELQHSGENNQRITQLYQAVANKEKEVDQLRQQLDQAMRSYQIIQQKDRMLAERESELVQSRQQLDQANVREREKDETIMRDYQIIRQNEQMIAQKEQEIQRLAQLLCQATFQDGEKDQRIAQLAQERNQTIAGKDQEIQQLRIRLQQATLQERAVVEIKRELDQVADQQVQLPMENVGEKPNIDRENKPLKRYPEASNKVVPLQDMKLSWREGPKAPQGMKRASDAAVSRHDNVVYVLPFSKHNTAVYKFSVATSLWSSLKPFPYKECSLVVVKDLPIVVGGYGLSSCSSSLFSYTDEGNEGRWTKIFTPMPTARANASVMVVGERLFVIGGENMQEGGPLAVVEVMNTETHQWSTLAPLPEPLVNASITACGNNIYILGGRTKMNKMSKSVYTCSLDALLLNSSANVWRKIAHLPLSESTCVSLHGRVLAFGGMDVANRSTKDIYMYNPATNSWKAVGEMLSDRHLCFAAVLPDNQLMVVGGVSNNSQTNSVEFGSVK